MPRGCHFGVRSKVDGSTSAGTTVTNASASVSCSTIDVDASASEPCSTVAIVDSSAFSEPKRVRVRWTDSDGKEQRTYTRGVCVSREVSLLGIAKHKAVAVANTVRKNVAAVVKHVLDVASNVSRRRIVVDSTAQDLSFASHITVQVSKHGICTPRQMQQVAHSHAGGATAKAKEFSCDRKTIYRIECSQTFVELLAQEVLCQELAA